jgi:hypothetical protein
MSESDISPSQCKVLTFCLVMYHQKMRSVPFPPPPAESVAASQNVWLQNGTKPPKCEIVYRYMPILLWRVYPLLGNGSVNTFPQYKLSTIEWHPLLGNEQVNTHSEREKTVISVGSALVIRSDWQDRRSRSRGEGVHKRSRVQRSIEQ